MNINLLSFLTKVVTGGGTQALQNICGMTGEMEVTNDAVLHIPDTIQDRTCAEFAIDEQNDFIPETLVAPPTWTVLVFLIVVTISMLQLTTERKARQRLQRVNTTRARGRQASIAIVIRERDERTSQEILIDSYTTICSLILELDSRTNNLIRITLGEGSD
ncbi:hypothetical protein QTG54_015096 [Skeletonema marinoi]|uniref:Uncharacterized protein n=1 Tax=Skeletonema marinoi TaxID=267567 RepID=A0AAD8XVF9_9STRA|nr:hypothetical protein QTG54_015096 [Skeletonema marinoi]